MNERIRELAIQAGFCFWDDEEWKPSDAEIDWASQYDEELQKLINLIVIECGQIADSSREGSTFPSVLMKNHFGVNDE